VRESGWGTTAEPARKAPAQFRDVRSENRRKNRGGKEKRKEGRSNERRETKVRGGKSREGLEFPKLLWSLVFEKTAKRKRHSKKKVEKRQKGLKGRETPTHMS